MADQAAPLHIVVFLGSTRTGRLGGRVATFVTNYIQGTGAKVSLIDPVELGLPVLEKPHFYYRGDDKPPEKLDAAANIVASADGFVVVSGEYNHAIPPALTNTMSHFGGSKYAFKPCAIVTYSAGQFGGMRAAMQLRPFLSELGCLTTSNILAWPEAQHLLGEDGKLTKDEEAWNNRAKRCFEQLFWVANGLKNHKANTAPPS